jgi:hypothetical protein
MGLSPSSAFLVPAATPDSTTSQTIGLVGPKAASVWRQRTISEALDDVLFPTIPAVYLQPTLTLSTTANLVVERGSTFTNPLNPFVPTWTQNNAGPAILHTWLRNGVEQIPISGAPVNRANISESNVTSNITYRARVDYEDGPQLNDNKGQPSGEPILSGNILSNQLTIVSIFPYYHLKSPVQFTREQFTAAIAAGNASGIHPSAVLTKVVAAASGTLSIPYNLNAQFFGVAHPIDYPAKTSYFVTTLDSGPIGAVFSPTQTATTAGTTWSGKDFLYYLTPGPITNANPTIQLS